jgi:hypothetical protein
LQRTFITGCIFFQIIVLTSVSVAQTPSDTGLINHKLLKGIIAVESIATVTSLTGLSVLWYADYPHTSFHFINDNSEWLQMDKAGHLTTAYFITKTSYDLLRWPGVERRKAVWYGGATSFAYLAFVELMDGFSADWGFSPGDLAANTIGSAAFIGQQLIWNEQRFSLKWSYHGTSYPQYRPNVLGRNFPEKMLKDYNGQTYWLSTNIHSFLNVDSHFPKWLNVAFGYSAEGMLGAYSNPSEIDGKTLPSFERIRQYFFSLDLDMTRIKTRSKALNAIFNFVGVLKFPFPSIEYNSKNQWIVHGLYF